jgi:hypothetical protein
MKLFAKRLRRRRQASAQVSVQKTDGNLGHQQLGRVHFLELVEKS